MAKAMIKYGRKKDVVARSVAGANLLVPVHGCTRSVFTLNEAGSRLWELIEEPRSEEELAASLVEQYGIPSEIARRDVRAFLEAMVRKSLVDERE